MEKSNQDWSNFREVFSIPPTREDEYREKRVKIIDEFSTGFVEKNIQTDALTVRVIECLIRNENPYTIIEQLIRNNQEQHQKILELVDLIPPPPIPKK
jgi:hypothetical protein